MPKKSLRLSSIEKSYLQKYDKIIGIDEVGRGSIAGPMVVCGFLYSLHDIVRQGVNDSKLLTRSRRAKLYKKLIEHEYLIIEIPPYNIDEKGITQTFKEAVHQIFEKFYTEKSFFLIDGNLKLNICKNMCNIVKGDRKVYSIAAASIIAKVYRDNLMFKLSEIYPDYKFENNVGYGTVEHLDAIKRYGITEIHRKTFYPIKLKY